MKAVEILVVEDSPTQALKLKYTLEKEDYVVRLAADGKEGLAAIHERRPTLIISDVLMPEMDGYELCSIIKTDESLRDIPVILLTTLSDPQDIIRGLESGADNFLNKPYNEEMLLSRIKYILINLDVRSRMRTGMGIEIYFANKKHYLTSERIQIIDLLLSTYENSVEKNKELEAANDKLIQTQQELENSNQQLLLLNEQKNMLLNMAAHDLRNPLSLIEGYCDLLLKDQKAPIPESHFSIISTIRSNSHFMLRMLNDLLDVQKIEAGSFTLELRESELTPLLMQVISAQEFAARKKGVELILREAIDFPPFLFDPGRIEQVMTNLIDNAIKFSYKGSVVEINIGQDDASAYISVSDYGPGIPETDFGKLFKPFSRTRVRPTGSEKSTGIGLAIARSIVEMHGGSITVESTVGKGSTFRFTIPM